MKLHIWLGDASYEVSREDGFTYTRLDESGVGFGLEVLGNLVFIGATR